MNRRRWYDYAFPFWRAMLEVRHNDRAMLWIMLVLLVFGPGIAYALIRTLGG